MRLVSDSGDPTDFAVAPWCQRILDIDAAKSCCVTISGTTSAVVANWGSMGIHAAGKSIPDSVNLVAQTESDISES